jgi:rSAM/selenodomain-associated transferase 1
VTEKQPSRPHLGVFVKAPLRGTVKTRLAKTIGRENARTLYEDMAVDTLQWVGKLDHCGKTVFYSPLKERELCRDLLAPGCRETSLQPQVGGGLGSRMQAAFSQMFSQGAASAVLIGSDCPLLDGKTVRKAFASLKNNDLVLGPTSDGGYYLIGLRVPAPELFQIAKWSHSLVLQQTIDRARKTGLKIELLPTLRDIDQGEDIALLGEELLEAWLHCRNGIRTDFPLRVFRRLLWEPGTLIYQMATNPPQPAGHR